MVGEGELGGNQVFSGGKIMGLPDAQASLREKPFRETRSGTWGSVEVLLALALTLPGSWYPQKDGNGLHQHRGFHKLRIVEVSSGRVSAALLAWKEVSLFQVSSGQMVTGYHTGCVWCCGPGFEPRLSDCSDPQSLPLLCSMRIINTPTPTPDSRAWRCCLERAWRASAARGSP